MSDLVYVAHHWRSNAHLIADVARLGYLRPDDLIVDPTFGRGKWWTRVPDLTVCAPGPGHNFTSLPYPDDAFDVAAYDPPYVSPGGRSTTGIAEFFDRYGLADCPKDPTALQDLIDEGLAECVRVVRKRRTKRGDRGLLLVKCQNYVSSGALHPGAHLTYAAAVGLGCSLLAEFVHLSKTGGPQPKGRTRRCVACRGSGWTSEPAALPPVASVLCPTCRGLGAVPSVQQHPRANASTLYVFHAPLERSPR